MTSQIVKLENQFQKAADEAKANVQSADVAATEAAEYERQAKANTANARRVATSAKEQLERIESAQRQLLGE